MRHTLLALACLASPTGLAGALEGPRYQVTLRPVSGWTKICRKDEAGSRTPCYTSRLYGTDARKPPMLDLSVRDVGRDGTHILRFLVPAGLRTDLGLTFSVDGGDRQPGVFRGCAPTGCFAEAALGSPVLAAMKKGGTMQIVTTDGRNRRIDFYLSLNGFAEAYDAAAGDDRSLPPSRKAQPDKALPRGGGTSI